MKKLALVFSVTAGPLLAHPGPHLHPHDGASWLAVAGALAVLGLACGVAVATVRRRK